MVEQKYREYPNMDSASDREKTMINAEAIGKKTDIMSCLVTVAIGFLLRKLRIRQKIKSAVNIPNIVTYVYIVGMTGFEPTTF